MICLPCVPFAFCSAVLANTHISTEDTAFSPQGHREYGTVLPVRRKRCKTLCSPAGRRWRHTVSETGVSETRSLAPYRSSGISLVFQYDICASSLMGIPSMIISAAELVHIYRQAYILHVLCQVHLPCTTFIHGYVYNTTDIARGLYTTFD